MTTYTFSMDLRVHDEHAIRQLARQQAINDGLGDEIADEFMDEDINDITDCLQMILDPSCIEGAEILGSAAECTAIDWAE
ncbi:hypothetical protein [Castellaniella sp.]|uniref:hypothetical protein n=1 Tax=Castellaniella sp. TaxID=1955812 RepID=UPI002AFDD6D5|nr:hypothetical protein [Castellaniella sp.]